MQAPVSEGRQAVPAANSGAEAASAPRWDGTYPLHPFLLALASTLVLMVRSLNQTNFGHVLPAMGGALAFAALVYLVVALVRRRFDVQAAVIASIWVAGALFYVDLFDWANRWLAGGYPMVRSLYVALPVLVLLTILVLWLPQALVRVVHLVLTGIAVVLLASPAWQAISYEWRYGVARSIYDPDQAAAAMFDSAPAAPTLAAGDHTPDIYYFVFDRYASEEVLDRYYDLDDSGTRRFLEERGFFVTRAVHANYHRTAHSVGSTFYMDYLDFLVGDDRVPGNNWQTIHSLLRDHRVARFLRAQGYDFVQYGSWWTGTFHNPAADSNRPYGFSEYNMLYLRRTMLRPIFHALPDTQMTMRLDWDNAQCQRMAPQLEDIKSLGEQQNPIFVFAHILVPHGPYNFATDGRCLSQAESAERGSRQGYIDQVVYASRMIEDLVTALQAPDRAPPIIIISSDEGPFPPREQGMSWRDVSADQLRIKTGIINAFYFPNGDYSQLYETISPVNTYRVIFNSYFGTDFPLLPDRTFVFDDSSLYDYHEVTHRLREEEPLDADDMAAHGVPHDADGQPMPR